MPMLTRRLHNFPLFCLLLLSLLTSPVSTFGYVWCVGSDGHATMEAAMAGDCGLDHPVPSSDHDADRSGTIATEDCGPCLDVSPSHQMGSSRSRQNQAPACVPVETAPFVVIHSPQIDFILSEPLLDAPTPRTPEPILHHRTIVLLI